MNFRIARLFWALIAIGSFAYAQPASYRFTVDMTAAADDKVPVVLDCPPIDQDQIVYYLPKIVPGTYDISDFGRFVSDFKALDTAGQELPVENLKINGFKISQAKRLSRISYKVDDTFDSPKSNPIFEPGGSNIEEGKNFLFNPFAFFGYFEGMKRTPYELSFVHPEDFYGATSLEAAERSAKVDRFLASDYMLLADSPIMYNRPDTASVRIGQTDVLVSIYNNSGRAIEGATAKDVAKNVEELLDVQRQYLGGTLPVDRYAFLIYLNDGTVGVSGAYGALEHSQSSVYFLPIFIPNLAQTVRDVAAHEFFHIVTPLTIHSEEIGDFDFIEPDMSKHLWLYEGCVEYFSHHAQVQYGLISEDDFYSVVRNKINQSLGYNDTLPFTTMSENCLVEYKDQYGNVYEKGALIGMCVDLLLLDQTDGQYGLMDLIGDLQQEYGRDKSFKDEELFGKIGEIVGKQAGEEGAKAISEFFERYVAGPEQLPLDELLGKVGISYVRKATEERKTLGNIGMIGDPETNRLKIDDLTDINDFGRDMGYEVGDIIIKIGKRDITLDNYQEVFDYFRESYKVGKKLKVIVRRDVVNKKGISSMEDVKLKAKVRTSAVEIRNRLEINDSPEDRAAELRKAWLTADKK